VRQGEKRSELPYHIVGHAPAGSAPGGRAMTVKRRDFLRLSGMSAAAFALGAAEKPHSVAWCSTAAIS